MKTPDKLNAILDRMPPSLRDMYRRNPVFNYTVHECAQHGKGYVETIEISLLMIQAESAQRFDLLNKYAEKYGVTT